MKPFVLKQHDQDFAAYRQLRDEEMTEVYGGVRNVGTFPIVGTGPIGGGPGDPIKLNTATVTPNGDGGDDGPDEG